MTELVSMLVPLQGTLPGWPIAEAPPMLVTLGLLIGLPAVFFVGIALVGKAGELIRAGRGEDASGPGEPMWLGALPVDRSAVTGGAPAAVPGEGRRAIAGGTSTGAVGGASARW